MMPLLHSRLPYLGLVVLLSMPAPAHSLSTDKSQPLILLADRINFHQKSHQMVLTGHVLLRQGTSRLRAMTLHANADYYNQLLNASAVGQPASFVTRPDESAYPLHASAKKITYLPQQHQVVLEGDAQLTWHQQHYRSEKITYDLKQLRVVSNQSKPHQRSVIILTEDSVKHA